MDLRIIKTHKALADTFMQLLGEKRFEDITVSELCERAMVRRATFYKHFADIYEFFAFVITARREQTRAQSQEYIDETNLQSLYLNVTRNAIAFVNSNKKLVQLVLESKMLFTVLEILSEQIAKDLTQRLKKDVQNGIPLPASPQFMAYFFTGALMYTLKWWVKQKNVSEAELMKELTSLLHAF